MPIQIYIFLEIFSLLNDKPVILTAQRGATVKEVFALKKVARGKKPLSLGQDSARTSSGKIVPADFDDDPVTRTYKISLTPSPPPFSPTFLSLPSPLFFPCTQSSAVNAHPKPCRHLSAEIPTSSS